MSNVKHAMMMLAAVLAVALVALSGVPMGDEADADYGTKVEAITVNNTTIDTTQYTDTDTNLTLNGGRQTVQMPGWWFAEDSFIYILPVAGMTGSGSSLLVDGVRYYAQVSGVPAYGTHQVDSKVTSYGASTPKYSFSFTLYVRDGSPNTTIMSDDNCTVGDSYTRTITESLSMLPTNAGNPVLSGASWMSVSYNEVSNVFYLSISGTPTTSGTYNVSVTIPTTSSSSGVPVRYTWTCTVAAPEEHVVSYRATAGSIYAYGSTASQTVVDGSSVSLRSNGFTAPGYTFTGWKINNSGSLRAPGYNYTPSNDVTVYAQWSGNQYTLTFDARGGTCSTSTKTVTYGSSLGTLPTPTYAGHTFVGWSTSYSTTTMVYSSTVYQTTANDTLYAIWSNASYTVSLNAGAGTVSPTSITVSYNGYYANLPTPTPPSGKDFRGWFTSTTGETRITTSSIVTATSNHTLYALYMDKPTVGDTGMFLGETYTIELEPSMATWTTVSIPSWATFDNNYTISGTPTAVGTFTFTMHVNFNETALDEDVTWRLTVSEQLTYYTTTFDSNGGSQSPDSVTVEAGENLMLPNPGTKEGHVFLGWSKDSVVGNIYGSVGASYVPTESRELVALWDEEYVYTLTFNANGGTGAPSDVAGTSTAITYSISVPQTTPTKEGSAFSGWVLDTLSTSADYMPGDAVNFTSVVPSKTLYALWTEDSDDQWTVTSVEGGVRVTGYAGSTVDIIVPSTIEGSTVLQIGADVFPSTVTTVVLPSTLESFDDFITAEMTRVTIPASAIPYIRGGIYLNEAISLETISVYNGSNTLTIYTCSADATGRVGLNLQGSTGTPGEIYLPTSAHTGMRLNGTYTLDGPMFTGWYQSSNNTGSKLADAGQRYTITSNSVLCAHWDDVASENVTLTFNAKGGVMAETSVEMPRNSPYVLPVPTKAGFEFEGWYFADCGGGSATGHQVLSEYDQVSTNAVLYAGWADTNTRVVSFETSGGSTVTPQTVEIGGFATVPEPPTRTGFVFSGWYPTAACEGAQFAFDTTAITDNTTVYALWVFSTDADADFSYSIEEDNPRMVRFTDMSSGADVWTWNFGDVGSDSNTSTSQNPSHEFSGDLLAFQVTLTVSGTEDGHVTTDTMTKTVRLYETGGGTTPADDASAWTFETQYIILTLLSVLVMAGGAVFGRFMMMIVGVVGTLLCIAHMGGLI